MDGQVAVVYMGRWTGIKGSLEADRRELPADPRGRPLTLTDLKAWRWCCSLSIAPSRAAVAGTPGILRYLGPLGDREVSIIKEYVPLNSTSSSAVRREQLPTGLLEQFSEYS
ncbi:hypothetical protein I7I51_00471 [Histoplasma capsulatum]|uniref:Uncharacterized protein n=1 Tax=Ajellomyces capsulatus TaxID=5037 RepID=A0A8A1MFG6_AJECA|nr:hypothetical protein I7I51_00471 [Histoplasma capsulatum]